MKKSKDAFSCCLTAILVRGPNNDKSFAADNRPIMAIRDEDEVHEERSMPKMTVDHDMGYVKGLSFIHNAHETVLISLLQGSQT